MNDSLTSECSGTSIHRSSSAEVVIGVISDTHGLLRNEALVALRGVEIILHAGDVGDPEILDVLGTIAPVHAVRGNVDRGTWAQSLPRSQTLEIGDQLIHMLHIEEQLDLDPGAAEIAAVIYGHSHRPSLTDRQGVLFMNPGSAGPRRFRLPVTVGRIILRNGVLEPSIIDLSL